MLKFERDSKITILKKERKVSDLIETLIFYPAEEVGKFFTEINLSFPRRLRVDVLRRVLRDSVIKTREERATLADEMNYRLSWFNQYTESQLVNLFAFYKNEKLDALFLEEFWLEVINYITDKKIAEKDFNRLVLASQQYAKSRGLTLPDIVKYNAKLDPLFYDDKNKIDGLMLNIIRPVLYKSSTLTEIRQIGKKYGVNVPNRLKKSQLIEIILNELEKRGELTDDKEQELKKMSVLAIQRYAKNNDIKASTELKKEEIIEYVLSNAEETRASYFIPSSSVYELEAHDVGEAMPTPKIIEEEPIEEVDLVVEDLTDEVEEEVKEEIVSKPEVATEKVVYVNQTDQAIIDELVDLREEVEYLKARSKNVEVKKTVISTVQYSGKKPKKFGKKLKADEAKYHDEDEKTKAKEQDIQSVYIAGFSKDSKRKKRNPIWALVRVLLIIIALLLLLLLIYGLIRPVNGYPGFEIFDDFINKIKITGKSGNKYGILDYYTTAVRKLFKL